jgi:uncharacterized protein involved in exopolysaccharide biosynthesis
MEQPFDGIQFTNYVGRHWLVIAICCTTAIAVTAVTCLLVTKRYTATASVLIEPPAGNDPRGATAVSPVYLESLKTYERFASSDTVFATALSELKLLNRFSGASVESIKRSVLKVARPTNTKVVEISVTLDDPKSAQGLAQHIAEQTIALNQRLNDRSTEDVLRESKSNRDKAKDRLDKAEKAREELTKAEAIDALQSEVTEINQLRLSVEQDLGKTRAELADMQAELKTFHAGDGLESQADWTIRQVEALRARIGSLEEQTQALRQSGADKTNILESRKQRREAQEAELRSARADYELAKTRFSDAQGSVAYRGERLELMDPGIIPERPSFPNTPLNVMLAFIISIVLSIGYLALRFGYTQARRYRTSPEYSMR